MKIDKKEYCKMSQNDSITQRHQTGNFDPFRL